MRLTRQWFDALSSVNLMARVETSRRRQGYRTIGRAPVAPQRMPGA
jgi:hypothetical protein